MSTYQVSYKIVNPQQCNVIVQMNGDTVTGGYTLAKSGLVLTDASDAALTPDNNVEAESLFQIVRDALYSGPLLNGENLANIFPDMSRVVITVIHPTSMTVAPASISQAHGAAAVQLVPTFTPASSTNRGVVYTSSNPAVATVSNTGLVTGVAAGSAVINCAAVDEELINESSSDMIWDSPLVVNVNVTLT